MKRHLLRFLLALLPGACTLTAAPATAIFGNVTVTQNDAANTASSITMTVEAGSSPGFATVTAGSSRGDYYVDFGHANDVATGVLIPTVTENTRNNSAFGDAFGEFVATSASAPRASDTKYYVAVFRAAQGDEVNVNFSAGFFPYNEWLGGTFYNSANGGPITSVHASPGIELGTQVIDNRNGQFDVDLVDLGGSSSLGILLVAGAKNEDNYALSKANPDGTFRVFVHDNGVDSSGYEQDPFCFVYVPVTAVGNSPVVALGRVNGDASTDLAAGNFTVVKGPTGQWFLSIPGHTGATGVLLVSPEGGVGTNVDNTLTAQWDGAAGHWIIESRDISGEVNIPGRQNLDAANDAFSFAFLSTTPAPLPPEVALTSPADGATFAPGATITLQADASSADPVNAPIARVEFREGNTLIGAATSAPWTFAWSDAALGVHRVTARVIDSTGSVSTSDTVTLEVRLAPGEENGLFFDGTDDYVTFGNNPELGLRTFTLECWFLPLGAGQTAGTGSGGVTAVPLITKGRGQDDDTVNNCNYFLGIDGSTRALAADFEDYATGLNHPVTGRTAVQQGVWQHAAVTFDGSDWRLYLNGELEAVASANGQIPRYDSIQHSAIGSAMDTFGVPAGYFAGVMDEVRIWNHARTQDEIRGTMNYAVVDASGLVGRWSMDKEEGGTLTSTSAGAITGTLVNGPSWTTGVTGLGHNDLPTVSLTSPSSGAVLVSGSTVELVAEAADADGTVTKVEFYDNSTKIGETTSAPWTLAWTAEGYGAHTLSARATDDIGATSVATVDVSLVPAAGSGALYFDGVDDYVTFGDAPALKLATFTVETWFRRVGAGSGASSGSGGVTVVPLISKGRGENDNDTLNCNYLIGLRTSDGVIAADFEEGPGGSSPGLNHPVIGGTPVTDDAWHHVAVSYDGTTWRIYLDGHLDAELFVGQPVASNSIQHAALGSALNSTGVPQGFFHGFLDETRVWNRARTLDEIRSTMNNEVPSADGLVARWAMTDEASSGTLVNSAGSGTTGTLTGGASFAASAPLSNDVPPTVTLVSPDDAAAGLANRADLRVSVGDADSSSLTVKVYGRPAGPARPGPDFTVIALPDTQYYSSTKNGGTPAMFSEQTDWIVSELDALNIRFVLHLGDITDNGDSAPQQWVAASDALYRLEDPATTLLEEGMSYSVAVGNHDQYPNGSADGTTYYFNQYFGVHPETGVNHFEGKSYYGGTRIAENADDNYTLFSASGLDFIVVSLEYDTTPDQEDLDWADSLLKAYPDRRAIIVTHHMVNTGNPASFSPLGQAIYNALKNNPNLMLMHGGHIHGEGRRADTWGGRTVHSILADYQSDTNGGNGWLRILHFSPANNTLSVETYSPVLGQYRTGDSSRFTLDIDLSSGLGNYEEIATRTGIAPGDTVTIPWEDLRPGARYEWYVEVSDGSTTIASPVRGFSTQALPEPPVIRIINPANNASFVSPAEITLEADATDADGTVAKVEFFDGTTLLHTATSAPWTYAWTDAEPGSHVIVAVATDNDDQTATTAINLDVVDPVTAWLDEHLPEDSTLRGFADDADGDGTANFLEYAFDSDPATPDRASRPVTNAGSGRLAVTFARPRADLTYTVQASNDLLTWTDLATNPGSAGSAVTVTDDDTTSPNRYLRLRVSGSGSEFFTTPSGRLTQALARAQETAAGFPLRGAPDAIDGRFAGFITAVTATTLESTDAGWTPGQLSQPAVPWFVTITSGAAAGRIFPVDTTVAGQNTASQLTLVTGGADLTALGIAPGVDTWQLFPADTLGTLFPAGTLLSGTATTADRLRLWNGATAEIFYHDGSHWRAEDGSGADNTLVRPDQAWHILRRQAALNLVTFGEVSSTDAAVEVARNGTSYVSLLPVPRTFAELPLQTLLPAWASNPASPTAGDHVRLWNAGAWITYYHDGANWRRQGASAVQDNTRLLTPGRPVYIVRPAATGETGSDVLTQTRTW
ncbi:putative phosphohydrolase [Opitutaceae bacterium TAV1]|nr:putative phosphohydrolase [Opitutaceae bacterium TAV1]